MASLPTDGASKRPELVPMTYQNSKAQTYIESQLLTALSNIKTISNLSDTKRTLTYLKGQLEKKGTGPMNFGPT